MALDRRKRELRRHIEQIEGKRKLQQTQGARRRRDNLFAGVAAVVVLALAMSLQLFWFASDPTAAEMDLLDDAPGVQPTGTAEPDAGPTAIPDPATVEGQTFTGTLATSAGDVGVELDGNLAPQAVAVFTSLAEDDFFEGKSCHRLTTAESMGVLQCGSLNGDGASDPNFQWGPIENTPEDGMYPAGSIAVARGASPDTHGTQFFIVYKESQITQETGGYTIMGSVTSGLETVQEIAEAGVEGGGQDGPPVTPVTIDSLTLR